MSWISRATAATATALLATAALSAPGAAWAAGSVAPSQPALEAQAQMIASQIQADAHQLDVLAGQYQAAQLRLRQLASQQAQLTAAIRATNAAVDQLRQALKQQAIAAYLTGGAPVTAFLAARPLANPSVTAAYAEIVASGEQRAVSGYRAALDRQAAQRGALADARRQAAITLADVRTDQAAATQTIAAQRAALAQVKGQLAVLVAQAQSARQKAEQAAAQAELASRTSTTAAPAQVSTSTVPPTTASASPAPASPPTTRPAPTTPPTTAPPAPPPSGGSPAPGASAAIAYARAQIGKPYKWGGAGPDSFDCSGLTMMAWEQAGVYFPHLAQAQFDMTARVAIGNLLPGDLVFYGTPSNVYHVGLYIGNGNMIDAPATGEVVHIQSIYWDGLLGGGRVSS